MDPQEQPQGLITIERVVAFVVGPLLTVGFGWLSSWLALNVPGAPPIPPEAAVIVGGAVSVAVAGLVYKWLHGRQVMPPAALGQLLADRPPPDATIEPAEHDPAPVGQVADGGAASTS